MYGTVRQGNTLALTRIRSQRRKALGVAVVAVLSVVYALLLGLPSTARAATQGPCDIYAAGGTPCVAAHSTTRALYGAYNGPLYQVRRASDNTTRDIGPTSPGGDANAAAQDSFCAGTSCLITIIYDQSGRGNNLTQAQRGGWPGPGPNGVDNLANATAAPITIGGNEAYGVYVAPGTGYRNNSTSGIATGDQPEGMYAIFDGTHYNGGCCFDYGNAETSGTDTGNGHMEAIYFGNIKVWGYGTGNGPWVMADLENGLFSGVTAGYNANDPSVNHRFLTAIIKGEPNHWAIRAGDAQTGSLSTYYDGVRPNVSGYNPMHKEGAIILGTGGDNSNGSAGTFYEGVMTSGYPSASTEDAVQANIVAAGYGVGSGGGGTGYVRIQNHATGLFIDGMGRTSNGSNAGQWGNSNSTNQQWQIIPDGSYVQIQNHATGLYLDGMGRTSNGSVVGQWSNSNSNNQQWTETTSGGYTRFQNRATGLFIDGMGSTANGSDLGQWGNSNSTNQQWQIISN